MGRKERRRLHREMVNGGEDWGSAAGVIEYRSVMDYWSHSEAAFLF